MSQVQECHILHSLQKTELTSKNLQCNRTQESLNAKRALCKGSVSLKKTHVVSVNMQGLSKLPPDTPTRHSLSQLSPQKLSSATASYLLAAFTIP